jgi:hypothetical protein
MTWLGKILTIVIFFGALFWAYLNVQSHVLSTNWKVERDRYATAYKEAAGKRQDDYNRHLAAEDLLRRQIAIEQTKNAALSKTIETLSSAAKKGAADFVALQNEFDKGDINAVKHQANIQTLNAELNAVRERNYLLEDNSVKQAIATEEAKAEMVRAQNSEKLAQQIAADNAQKAEALQNRVNELRAQGAGGGPGAGVLNQIDRRPAPVLANLRGEVTDVAGDLVTISIGIDAGLGVGTVLEIYRVDGGGRYLGTVKVTDAFNLYSKQAVVKFTPASGKPLSQLRPEELPRKGDRIRPVSDGR